MVDTMLKVGLEFANGTTDDSKKLVSRLFTPADILVAMRDARAAFNTSDVVLVASDTDADGFDAMPRRVYIDRLRQVMGHRAPRALAAMVIAHKSAQKIVQLPKEDEAAWLIVTRGKDMPVMCVVYATPYKISEAN